MAKISRSAGTTLDRTRSESVLFNYMCENVLTYLVQSTFMQVWQEPTKAVGK